MSAGAIVLLGAGQPGWATFVQFVSAGLLLASASASAGGLLGFLFGIPRSLQQEGGEPPPAAVPSTQAQVPAAEPSATMTGPDAAAVTAAAARVPPRTDRPGTSLRVNTNLEQISDWLTKILVGVGLTNIREMGAHLWTIAGAVAPPLGGNVPVALFCMISFSIWGFFAAYLLTRLFLAAAFFHADDASSANREALLEHEQAAFELSRRGAHGLAVEHYELALRLAVTADERRRLAEAAIYNSLFAPPPEGFTDAIRSGQAYMEQPGNLPSARIWTYLAAARGQQYADAVARRAPESDLALIENQALTAIREAIRREPGMKPVLRALWDPNDPSRVSHDDNDLEVFYPRDAFKALLN